MKLNKILLTIPALASVVLPLTTSCNKSHSNITIEFTGEKDITTRYSAAIYSFKLSETVDKDKIVFKMYNETLPEGGMDQPVMTLDGKNLYITVVFNTYAYSTYSFDIDFTIDGTKTTFNGFNATLLPYTRYVPTEALVINNNVLEGLNSSFPLSDEYDTLLIPSNVTSIKENAFKDAFKADNASSVTRLVFNENLTSIGANAFDGCNAFEELNISAVPVSTETCPITIGTNAFANWKENGTLTYASGLTSYDLLDFAICDQGLGQNWFTVTNRKTKDSDFDISADGKTVNSFKWGWDTAPRHIQLLVNEFVLPSSIVTIADNAFYKESSSESTIPNNFVCLNFENNTALTTIGKNAFRNSSFTQTQYHTTGELTLPSNLKTIGEGAFAKTKFTKVIFGASVEAIGKRAFYECSQLSNIDVSYVPFVPEDWNTDETFSGIASSGTIATVASTSLEWRNYFNSFSLDPATWIINNKINLFSGYTPALSPLPQQTITDKVDTLKQAFIQGNVSSPVVMDEIMYTLKDSLSTSGLTSLSLTVSRVTYNVFYDMFTIIIDYEAVLNGDEWSGRWKLSDISLGTTVEPTPQPAQEKMLFNFNTLFEESGSITIDETNNTTGEEHDVTIDEESELTPTALGSVLYSLHLFDTDAKTLQINSRYLGKCS